MANRNWSRHPLAKGPRVVEVASGLHHVGGIERSTSWQPRSVAVIAAWTERETPSRSLVRLAEELDHNGFDVIVACASDAIRLRWPDRGPRSSVYQRDNVGYDFGSWAEALHHLPVIRSAEEVLLMNDSFLGPFRELSQLIEDFRRSTTPVWGLVSSAQVHWHVQSHCIGYRQQVLEAPQLRRFWDEVRVLPDKTHVIQAYELGLSDLFARVQIPVTVRYPHEWVSPQGCNVTVEGWNQLLLLGFPFIKRELMRAPFIQTGIMRIDRDRVWERANQCFGVDLWEWL
jgi:hypothetical protein